MAGDWIKMRSDLAEDPAVIAMATRLETDEFSVVGRLHAFWSWIDRQSRDGCATGVTPAWLDRYVQREGFAAALVAVGWLVLGDGGLIVPNFDRHNGEPAKARALNTRNKQIHRSEAAVPTLSRSNRDRSATREEKRREEAEEPPSLTAGEQHPPKEKPVRKKAATHMTTEWRPPADLVAQMQAECPSVDVERAIPEFRDYWIGEGKAKADWPATFRNRVRFLSERSNGKHYPARTDRRTGPGHGGKGEAAARPTARDFGMRTAADILANSKR